MSIFKNKHLNETTARKLKEAQDYVATTLDKAAQAPAAQNYAMLLKLSSWIDEHETEINRDNHDYGTKKTSTRIREAALLGIGLLMASPYLTPHLGAAGELLKETRAFYILGIFLMAPTAFDRTGLFAMNIYRAPKTTNTFDTLRNTVNKKLDGLEATHGSVLYTTLASCDSLPADHQARLTQLFNRHDKLLQETQKMHSGIAAPLAIKKARLTLQPKQAAL